MSKQAFKRLRRKLAIEVNRKPIPNHQEGYPVYYITRDCGVLCAKCVNAEIDLIDVAARDMDKQWEVVATECHWEGEPLICDHCGDQIESAYGIPDSAK